MSSQLTHERCSELLADHLAGKLDPEQHRIVEDHLEHCAQCSVERAGLSALVSGGSENLTGDERVALRAAVLGSTSPKEEPARPRLDDESDAVVVPLGGRGARASKYLGIAALLAILAVGSLFVFRGGGLGVTDSGDDSEAGSAASTAEDSGEAGGEDEAVEDAAGREKKAPMDDRDTGLSYQSDRGAISANDLDRLGRRNSVSARSSNQATHTADSQYTEELSSRRAPEDQLGRLAARAPGSLAPDINECGRTALDTLEEPGLATYATTATLDGTDVIVIRFVTGDRTPDRYAVFAFPLGDCTTILTSTEGSLE